MHFKRSLTLALTITLLTVGNAQSEPVPIETIRSLTEENTRAAIALYREFLSLPNDANYPDDIHAMVEWMEVAFTERGFATQRIATEGSPLLLAERNVSDEAETVLIYLQSDGQPVDPSAWFQEDPYTPVLKERTDSGDYERIPWEFLDNSYNPDWRVFARSASDSKGPTKAQWSWAPPWSRPTWTNLVMSSIPN